MRIVIDECVDRRVKAFLPGHDVWTVPRMGWAGRKNGELLALMAAGGFEVLLTVDQNLRHQQNLVAVGVAVVIVVARSNRVVDLRPLMPQVLATLPTIRPGDVVEIA